MPRKKAKPKIARIEITYDGEAVAAGSMTLGRLLDYCEYEGEGLPDWRQDRVLLTERSMNFQVRITCDRELVTYLEIHEAGHKSFYSFPFKGIDYRDTVLASLDFQERLSRFLINYGIYSLFWALYRSKESDLKTRSEAFDRITEKFRKFFGRILKPKRERLIETKEEKGETIKTFELIETGRPTKTEAELDQERQEFKSDVFKALGRLKKENRQLTQYNAAMEIFDGVRNPERKELEKAIGNRLRKFGLTWKQLLKEFNP